MTAVATLRLCTAPAGHEKCCRPGSLRPKTMRLPGTACREFWMPLETAQSSATTVPVMMLQLRLHLSLNSACAISFVVMDCTCVRHLYRLPCRKGRPALEVITLPHQHGVGEDHVVDGEMFDQLHRPKMRLGLAAQLVKRGPHTHHTPMRAEGVKRGVGCRGNRAQCFWHAGPRNGRPPGSRRGQTSS